MAMKLAILHWLLEHITASWIAVCLTLFFSLHIVFLFTKRRAHADIYPIFGILFSMAKNRDRIHDWITDLLKSSPSNTLENHRLGGIRGFFTANPAVVEHILKTKFENYQKGERHRSLLHDFMGRGIFNADGELWKMQRKAASHEFSTKSLRNFVVETVQWEILHRLLPLLSSKRVSINLQDILQRFAFDNICRVAFGVDPGCLDPSLPDIPFARAFDIATETSFGRFLYSIPSLQLWKIKRMLNVGSEKRLREAIRVVDDFAMNIIRSRRAEIAESPSEKKDLLSRFMEAVTNWEGLNTNEIAQTDLFLKEMVINFMLAGRDTTSTSLTWFFWVLSSHPAVEEAIRRESMKVLAKRKAASEAPGDKGGVVFSFEELKEMKYLHAALCESLRLYPPVPLDSKVAMQDDVLPDGSVVKKGWIVDYSIYGMGRMESVWGADCLEFKPERWLNSEGELIGENPYKFVAFNGGARICLGKEMAFIQMKSIVASIVDGFRVKVDPQFVPRYSLDFNMRMKGGMAVSVTKISHG